MKTPVKTIAIAIAVLAMGTLGLTAGESSRKPSPSSSAKAVNGAHQAVVESRLQRQRSLVWNPCLCGPTPISVYRYGNPVAPVSNAFYGVPSYHQANFFRNYPTHRGR